MCPGLLHSWFMLLNCWIYCFYFLLGIGLSSCTLEQASTRVPVFYPFLGPSLSPLEKPKIYLIFKDQLTALELTTQPFSSMILSRVSLMFSLSIPLLASSTRVVLNPSSRAWNAVEARKVQKFKPLIQKKGWNFPTKEVDGCF